MPGSGPIPTLANGRRQVLPILLAAGLLAGCVATPPTVDDRLFFGRSIPGGGQVTEAQRNNFVAEVIAPRFHGGFTLWRASRHWQGDDGAAVSAQTCVLEVVHGADPAIEAKLAEIARAYRARFNQDVVMRIRSPADQTFWRR